jgi:hypothetical protein
MQISRHFLRICLSLHDSINLLSKYSLIGVSPLLHLYDVYVGMGVGHLSKYKVWVNHFKCDFLESLGSIAQIYP